MDWARLHHGRAFPFRRRAKCINKNFFSIREWVRNSTYRPHWRPCLIVALSPETTFAQARRIIAGPVFFRSQASTIKSGLKGFYASLTESARRNYAGSRTSLFADSCGKIDANFPSFSPADVAPASEFIERDRKHKSVWYADRTSNLQTRAALGEIAYRAIDGQALVDLNLAGLQCGLARLFPALLSIPELGVRFFEHP
jgi:hypothetical protein